MKLVCAILLVSALSGAGKSLNLEAGEQFESGCAYCQAGQFPEAAAAFERSAQVLPAAGTLVNLGIAEWQRGHAGAAILAWEQARWIDPFDPHAGANLKFARQVAQVDAPRLKWFEAASTWLPAEAWVWLAGSSLWLAVGMMILPGVLKWRKSGWQQALAALAWGFFLFSLTANLGVASRTQIGFVMKKDAALLLTPTGESEVISMLNGGESARRIRTRGDYMFVRTAFAAGWIRREQFGLVCPDQPDAMPAVPAGSRP